jgi:xanthine dehydrogenase accessory factor
VRELLPEIEAWGPEAQPFALATVVKTWGSAPRAAGSKMAVGRDGRIAGSVSGGCVEAAVVEAAGKVVRDGKATLLSFGVADDVAWSVGLSCGGAIEVFVDVPNAAALAELASLAIADRSTAVATVLNGPLAGRRLFVHGDGQIRGNLSGALARQARSAAEAALSQGQTGRFRLDEHDLFIEVLRPPPRLIVVGGVHIAVVLTSLARAAGYRTIVVDPRPAFADGARFPAADEVVAAWPEEALGRVGLTAETAVAILTHDPKLDDPALRAALPSSAFYVGALGSKQTQAKRRTRLLESGLTEAQVNRLRAPIGLDLGGRSPEEIAVAVMAQIVAVRNGRETVPVREPARETA